MADTFLFTSESVTCGHPDKFCDIVSDTVLDACLAQDPASKVACETATKGNRVILLGEITTTASVDFDSLVRGAVRKVGYTAESTGLDPDTCEVFLYIDQQSSEIAAAVHKAKPLAELCAGDQGHMFGYATDETSELMPLTHMMALRLCSALERARTDPSSGLSWLRPDAKSQVTARYKTENGVLSVLHIDSVLISTQHAPGISAEDISRGIIGGVVKPEFVAAGHQALLTDETKLYVNPSGSFVTGGPMSDAGLTGRKIIVDTYGGHAPHGGGAFSGKDPSKVDRSAAYAARWVAKSIVAAKLARRCQVQIAYGIGLKYPLSVHVDTFGTGTHSDMDLLRIVNANFDLSPGGIVRDLDLLRPVYSETASGGHFGRTGKTFTWEQPRVLDLSCLDAASA